MGRRSCRTLASRQDSADGGAALGLNPAPVGVNALPWHPLTSIDDPARARLGDLRPHPPASRTLFSAAALAHRLTEAWGRELTLRAGFGVFRDLPVGVAHAAKAATPYRRTRRTLAAPFSPGAHLTPPPIRLEPPFDELSGIDPALRNPTVYHYSAGLHVSLGAGGAARIGYLGSRGRRLLQREVAAGPSADVGSLQAVRSSARANYHGLRLQLEKDYRGGLQLLAPHTWSRSFDTASDSIYSHHLLGGDPEANYGPSDFDIRQLTAGAFSWQPPGPAGPWRPLLRDWGVSGIFRLQSALPVAVYSQELVQRFVRFRPNLVPAEPVWLHGPQYPGGRAINRAAFQRVRGANGDLGRNVLRGFPFQQVDLSVWRVVPLNDRIRLQIRAELFNVLNSASFANPAGNLLESDFGESTATFGRGLGAGGVGGGQNPLFAVGGPRSIQLSLRLSF